jgi:hypothetical protein
VLAAEVTEGQGTPGTTLDDALTIACGQNALRPTLIQRAGKPAMPTADLLRGRPFPPARNFHDPLRLHAGIRRHPFMGLQRQAHGPSVQQAVEEAIERVTGEPAILFAAGRTDAGVHALQMRAHADIAKDIAPFRLMEALNFHLRPDPIAVLDCRIVADDWHARFSCIGRSYIYRIANRRAPLTLDANRAWQVQKPLDAEAMHEAAQAWSAGMISPPSAPSTAKPRARSKRWTASMSAARATGSSSTPPRGPTCIIRCARWWAACRWSGWAAGRSRRWPRLWKRVIARPWG